MVGTDIIEVARIENIIKEKGDNFLNKIYTKDEIDYCESKGPNKYQHYAGRFAAKESVFKAIDKFIGYTSLSNDKIKAPKLKDIEIIHKHNGSPDILIKKSDIDDDVLVFISISHIKEYAMAVAVVQKTFFFQSWR